MLAAGGMVLNIGLNLLLIPRGHALGAAWASLITQGAMAVAQMLVASRRYAMRAKLPDALRLLGYVAILLGAAFATAHSGIPFAQALLALVVVAAVGAFGTGLISFRGLRTVLSLREHG
jgi:O-antigen/teichoic acid export membrane protein